MEMIPAMTPDDIETCGSVGLGEDVDLAPNTQTVRAWVKTLT
ncbi:MAG: hypothetical protein ACYSOH_04605 [Planctomycetota bacterium]